jgi:Zn-dependent alcohol dehydrogenase
MISHRCTLPEVNSAIATMRGGASVHTMIHFDAA